jgi:uncharacterized protein
VGRLHLHSVYLIQPLYEMTYSAPIAATLALLLTALSFNVSRLRLRYKVSFGTAGHKDLEVAVRAHGNTLEQSLLFIALLICLEGVQGANGSFIFLHGLIFIGVRVLHALAIFNRWLLARQAAHLASVAIQVVVAVLILLRTWWA